MIVKYSKKFPYAPYLNEDIGFEIEIPDDGDPLEELATLKALAEKFHKENNPQLEPSQSPTIVHEHIPGYTMTTQRISSYSPLPSIDYKAKETVEKMIDDSTSVRQLEELDFEKIKEYGLMEYYHQKHTSLILQ